MPNTEAVALVAQRLFNHELLLALVSSGALSQTSASAVAGKTAILLRDIYAGELDSPFAAKLAEGFERVAAGILGLPQIDIPKK